MPLKVARSAAISICDLKHYARFRAATVWLTLRFTPMPQAELSQSAKLRQIFEPLYKPLAVDRPAPQV